MNNEWVVSIAQWSVEIHRELLTLKLDNPSLEIMDYETFTERLVIGLNLEKEVFELDFSNEEELPFNADLKYPLVTYKHHKLPTHPIVEGYHYSRRPDEKWYSVSLQYSERNQNRMSTILNDCLSMNELVKVDEEGVFDYNPSDNLTFSISKEGSTCKLHITRITQE